MWWVICPVVWSVFWNFGCDVSRCSWWLFLLWALDGMDRLCHGLQQDSLPCAFLKWGLFSLPKDSGLETGMVLSPHCPACLPPYIRPQLTPSSSPSPPRHLPLQSLSTHLLKVGSLLSPALCQLYWLSMDILRNLASHSTLTYLGLAVPIPLPAWACCASHQEAKSNYFPCHGI
jgi:hypothetical protein